MHDFPCPLLPQRVMAASNWFCSGSLIEIVVTLPHHLVQAGLSRGVLPKTSSAHGDQKAESDRGSSQD